MKITTFEPYILTKDAEPLIQLFGEMGFQKRHKQEDIAGQELTGIVMKDANGGKVTDLGSSRSVFMRSPSGFFITVIKHVKESF